MSVHDEDDYPWLRKEKHYIAQAIEGGKTLIGICLGSQLIAECLGANVFVNEHKEIGWFNIQWFNNNDQRSTIFKSFPNDMVAFHWHGETFDLPKGARRLASSQACLNQAFVYGAHVYGFQFHPEVMEENVRLMVENCRHELVEGDYVQNVDMLLKMDDARKEVNNLLDTFLDELLSNNKIIDA